MIRCQRCFYTWPNGDVCQRCAADTIDLGIFATVGHVTGPVFALSDVGARVVIKDEVVALTHDGDNTRVYEVQNTRRAIQGKVKDVNDENVAVMVGTQEVFLYNFPMKKVTTDMPPVDFPILDDDDMDVDDEPPSPVSSVGSVVDARTPSPSPARSEAASEARAPAAMAVNAPAVAASPLRPIASPQDNAMGVDPPAVAASPRAEAARRAPVGTNAADDLARAFAAQVVPLIWTGKSGWEYEANLKKLLSGHFDTSFPGPPIRVTPTLLDDLERHKEGWTVYHHREAKSRERLKAIFNKLITHRDVVSRVLQALIR